MNRPLLLACTLLAPLPLPAAVSLPSWAGGPDSTSQVFLFNSADLNPSPNSGVNAYGTATAAVDVGTFGNGWEDPAILPDSNPGHDQDGAWDIGAGSDGSLTFVVPVAPAPADPGMSYRLDILIYAVAFELLPRLPEPSVLGLNPSDLVLESSNNLSTHPSGLGVWKEVTWSAVKEGHTASAITVALTPPDGEVSSVDRVEIYTRYTVVPEPSAAVLALLSCAAFAWRRRRVASM